MPFTFPPAPSDVQYIKNAVEEAKAELNFNERLRDFLMIVIRRFGHGDGDRIARAKTCTLSIIEEYINPEIQRIVLAPNSDAVSHPHYQQVSPREYHPDLDRYNSVTLFSGREEFSDDARSICQRIYNDPVALELKPVAILNLLHTAFWHEASYLTDASRHKELVASFQKLPSKKKKKSK